MVLQAKVYDQVTKQPVMAFDYKARSPYHTMTSAAGIPVNGRFRKIQQPDHGNGSSLPSISNKRRQSQQQAPSSFLLRLMAIDEKHEKKRQAREKELLVSKKKEVKNKETAVRQQNFTYVEEARGRWMSGQILDDDNHYLSYGVLDKQSDERLPPLSDETRTSSSPSVVESTTSKKEDGGKSDRLSPLLDGDDNKSDDPRLLPSIKKRPLRLPPLLLPPIYSVRPRPLKQREFLTPTQIRGPITDTEWDDLIQCRYLRQAPSRFTQGLSSAQSQSPFNW